MEWDNIKSWIELDEGNEESYLAGFIAPQCTLLQLLLDNLEVTRWSPTLSQTTASITHLTPLPHSQSMVTAVAGTRTAPRVFIGSSTESKGIAYAIQQELEADAIVTVWNQGIFELSATTIESLEQSLRDSDYAIFVFSPDDVSIIRAQEHMTARDNVVFELGLFIGHLGRKRTFIIKPRGIPDFHMPSDLLGITPATYDPQRPDKNVRAALGPACHQIRQAIQSQSSALTIEP